MAVYGAHARRSTGDALTIRAGFSRTGGNRDAGRSGVPAGVSAVAEYSPSPLYALDMQTGAEGVALSRSELCSVTFRRVS